MASHRHYDPNAPRGRRSNENAYAGGHPAHGQANRQEGITANPAYNPQQQHAPHNQQSAFSSQQPRQAGLSLRSPRGAPYQPHTSHGTHQGTNSGTYPYSHAAPQHRQPSQFAAPRGDVADPYLPPSPPPAHLQQSAHAAAQFDVPNSPQRFGTETTGFTAMYETYSSDNSTATFGMGPPSDVPVAPSSHYPGNHVDGHKVNSAGLRGYAAAPTSSGLQRTEHNPVLRVATSSRHPSDTNTALTAASEAIGDQSHAMHHPHDSSRAVSSGSPQSPVVQEDVALVIELRESRPGVVVNAVAAYPAAFMLLFFLISLAASSVPFFFPPTINASFETLTVQDQPVNDAVATSSYLITESSNYWSLSAAASEDDSTSPVLRRALLDATDAPFRDFVEYSLHLVFHRADKSTMLEPDTIARVKAVEDALFDLPKYKRLCLHRVGQETGSARECRRPVSATNFIYGTLNDDGAFLADGDSDEQQDPVKSAQLLVSQGATFFFDKDADFVEGTTSTLRSEVLFGSIADGVGGSQSASEDLYAELCKDMYTVLTDMADDDFLVTFGGEIMTDWEIQRQLLSDARFVAISVAIAVAMLAIATRSFTLTIFGVLQIIVSFPIAYALYYAGGNRNLTVIQFLSPFVILGIGLDDIFVFIGVYRSLQLYAHRFSLQQRLAVSWKRASGAMLATSATSAAAFAANIISPVPAVRLFGLLLALLVAVNFLLAITWLPASIVCWEKYLRFCSPRPEEMAAEERARTATAVLPFGRAPREGGASTRYLPHPPAPAATSHLTTSTVRGVPVKENADEEYRPSLFNHRYVWNYIFTIIWRGRFVFLGVLTAAAVVGAFLASRLEPSDSLPKLFSDDHNVQRFIDLWSTNFTDDSIFACPSCLSASAQEDLVALDDLSIDLDSGEPADGSEATTSDTGRERDARDGVEPLVADPVAAPPDTNDVTAPDTDVSLVDVVGAAAAAAAGVPIGSSDAETEASAADPDASDTAPDPTASTEAPDDETAIDGGDPPPQTAAEQDDSAIGNLAVDEELLVAERVNTNTLAVNIMWGVTNIIGSTSGDPFADAAAEGLEFDDSFDLSNVDQQIIILSQISDLVDATDGSPKPGRDHLVSNLKWDVLGALQEFCSDVASEQEYCSDLNERTLMPTGEAFHTAVWNMLRTNFEGQATLAGRSQDYKRSIGYDYTELEAPNEADVPRVKWLRLDCASATLQSAAPKEILASYNDWNKWADAVGVIGYDGILVSSDLWVQAVTDAAITEGIAWAIVLSSVFAMVSVYVFTGSVIVMGLATVTMACINILVLGLYQVMNWKLGAIEGVSITVLVGLSVDFSIHFSEAFVMSKLGVRRERARDAVMLMGTPVLSSAVSTVATALPLWLTSTVALRQFGVIISISLSSSFFYALLMLVPLLAMLGPQQPAIAKSQSWWRAVLGNRLTRAAIASAVCLLILFAVPGTNDLLSDVPVITWVLLAVIAAAVVHGVWNCWRFMRSSKPGPESSHIDDELAVDDQSRRF